FTPKKAEIGIFGGVVAQIGFVDEVFHKYLVALADLDEIFREVSIATVREIVMEVAGVASDRVAVTIEFLEHLKDLFETFGADLLVFPALEIAEKNVVRS